MVIVFKDLLQQIGYAFCSHLSIMFSYHPPLWILLQFIGPRKIGPLLYLYAALKFQS